MLTIKDNYTSDEVNAILDKYHAKVDKQFELLKKSFKSNQIYNFPMIINNIDKAQRGELK